MDQTDNTNVRNGGCSKMKKDGMTIGLVILMTLLLICLSVLFINRIKDREPTRAKLVLDRQTLSHASKNTG
jgi:hypothetical protein